MYGPEHWLSSRVGPEHWLSSRVGPEHWLSSRVGPELSAKRQIPSPAKYHLEGDLVLDI